MTRGDLMMRSAGPQRGPAPSWTPGTSALIVTYPDEILEHAVAKMAVNGVGRLPVVDRNHPTRLIGCLGRAGIAAAWRELLDEEEVREAGWLTSRMRLLRKNVRRVLEAAADSEWVQERDDGRPLLIRELSEPLVGRGGLPAMCLDRLGHREGPPIVHEVRQKPDAHQRLGTELSG